MVLAKWIPYLEHAKNFDAELIVEVGVLGMGHIIDEDQSIPLGLNTASRQEICQGPLWVYIYHEERRNGALTCAEQCQAGTQEL